MKREGLISNKHSFWLKARWRRLHSQSKAWTTGCSKARGMNWHKRDTFAHLHSHNLQPHSAQRQQQLSPFQPFPAISTNICHTLNIVILISSVSKGIVHPKLNPFRTVLTVVTGECDGIHKPQQWSTSSGGEKPTPTPKQQKPEKGKKKCHQCCFYRSVHETWLIYFRRCQYDEKIHGAM